MSSRVRLPRFVRLESIEIRPPSDHDKRRERAGGGGGRGGGRGGRGTSLKTLAEPANPKRATAKPVADLTSARIAMTPSWPMALPGSISAEDPLL